jgi:hypothetical protein
MLEALELEYRRWAALLQNKKPLHTREVSHKLNGGPDRI